MTCTRCGSVNTPEERELCDSCCLDLSLLVEIEAFGVLRGVSL